MADLKHLIVKDIKKVNAEIGGNIKRDEYLELGSFSKHDFVKAFGSWGEALKASGVKASEKAKKCPEMKKYEREVTKYDFKKALSQKFDSEIQPFIGKYEKDPKKVKTIGLIADLHSQFTDPFTYGVFLDVCRRSQADIVFGGDCLDFYEVSFHDRNPRRQMTMQSEINFLKNNILKPAREACPDSQIDYMIGNHEWRLFRYLCTQAPALSSLECLQFDNLLGLKDFGVNLVARKSFVNPKTKRDTENYKIYNDCFVITHGTSAGKHPADKELERWGMSGASGHVHRHSIHRKRDLRGFHEWHTLGAGCQLKSGEEYINDLVNWDRGFAIIHFFQGKPFVEYVNTENNFVCVGGKYYWRKDFLPK